MVIILGTSFVGYPIVFFSSRNEASYTQEKIVKQLAPQTNRDFICSECGLNHEVRDFIRNVLLHLIDQLEMSHHFIKFLKSKDFLNERAYEALQNIRIQDLDPS